MAVKISQLSASTGITSDDFFPLVDSGSLTTQRASAQQILDYVTSSISSSGVILGNTIDVSNSTSALRVTQRGTGDSILVEDSTNPDSTPFVVDNVGNVGVGTPNPSRKLHVQASSTGVSTIAGTSAIFENNGANYVSVLSSPTQEGGIIFGSTTSNVRAGLVYDHNTDTITLRNTSNQSRVTITDTDTSISGNLIVTGSATFSQITASSLSMYVSPDAGDQYGAVIDVATISSASLRVTQRAFGPALLVEDSNNPDSTPFIINNLGNVGVGTLTPTSKLTVSGTLNVTSNATLSTVSATIAQFTTTTASQGLITGDLRVLGTASINQLNTIGQQSLLIGDKYITILSGGVDHTGINGSGFLWGTSSGPGETTGALGEHAHVLYDANRDALEIFPGLYVAGNTELSGNLIVSGSTTLSTLSGTTGEFTTISASNARISGSIMIGGTANLGEIADYAYVLYTSSLDKVVVYPGLYVSGNLTGSGLGAFQTISASTYQGLPSFVATPGGTNTAIQFNSGSTFSGSNNLIYNYTTNTLSGTTAQFTTVTASNITIGLAEDGDYSDGLFADFTSTTPVGFVVDKFNEVLKGLAPQAAPSLSNLERNTAGGNNAILSFGASSSTGSYINVTASLSGLANIDVGGTFSVINGPGSNPIRLGVFVSLTALTLTLNNSVTANAGAFTNYPADALNVSTDGVGTFTIEMNGTNIAPAGTPSNTAAYNANNFNLSLANTASFISSGQSFDLFRHRTGTVSIPTANWRVGHNYVKVTHVSSLGTHVTNFIDWVYDPQAASGNSVYGFTTTSSSFTVGGLKELSGVKYYQTCTYNFSSSIANYYKNVYSTAANGGITFGSFSPASGLSAAPFVSTPAPVTSDDVLTRISLHTLTGVRVLSASLSSIMTVNNTFGKTGNTTLTTPKILFDNLNTANTDTIENFCLENYRVSSASYDTQISLTGAPAFPSGSSLSTSELATYNGAAVYPTTILNNGNVAGSGIEYMPASQPNYAGATQDRYYFRKFVNGANVLATFNLILTGSNINFTAFGGALTGNNVKIAIKVPGKTGWRDVMTAAPANTSGIALNDNVGCLQGGAPSNITTSAGRSIAINLLTEPVGANESYIVRIFTSKDWAGSITRLQIA